MNSRVSTKIQQLLNTLKRPKRPPLSEFFTDDTEEIVEGTQLPKTVVCSICKYVFVSSCSASVSSTD